MLIDSSAIVKFYSKEPGWESIAKYIDEAVTIPLALVELGNGLRKKVRDKEMALDFALEMAKTYSDSAILLEQKRYLVSAIEIAAGNGISVQDSIFISAARAEGHDLVSCDNAQMEVANRLGVKIIPG